MCIKNPCSDRKQITTIFSDLLCLKNVEREFEIGNRTCDCPIPCK